MPKEKFKTGALRDRRDGKGRFDLIPIFAERAEARIWEEGAKKYGDRNYEKGMPIMRMVDSLKRHLNQFVNREVDEDHAAHARCNTSMIIQTLKMIELGLLPKELDDRPKYEKVLEKGGF